MKKTIVAFFIVAGFVLLVGLPLTGSQAKVPAAPQVSTTATFRVAIADGTAPAVDILVDGVVSSLPSQNIVPALSVSGYGTITEGQHTISLVQSGTAIVVGPPLTFTAVATSDYTLVLLPGKTWLAAPLTDAKPVPVWPTVNVRLVNMSPNNNPVSLLVNGVVPAGFGGIAYQSTSAGYINMASGLYNLQVQGTTLLKPYNFQAGHDYSVFIFWDPSQERAFDLRQDGRRLHGWYADCHDNHGSDRNDDSRGYPHGWKRWNSQGVLPGS